MALKRKTCEDEVEKKTARMEDRLSNLPDDLKLRILSLLDTTSALKTTTLSKTWLSLWSWIPVLDFNSYDLLSLNAFDKFVNAALRLRDRSGSVELEQLTFIRQRGTCSAKLMKNVFEYAFSHQVKKFEAYIYKSRDDTWPVFPHKKTYSFESLTSLKLRVGGETSIGCPFLGPRSGSFKNLTVLHLRRAIITDLDPFSGFPVLERLTLVGCVINTEGKALNVHALNLSGLTIDADHEFFYCQLTTPRLRFFQYQGYCEVFKTHDRLRVFDTMVMGCGPLPPQQYRKIMFDNMLSLFSILDNVKSLTLYWSCVEFLSLFREELVKRTSPFRNLKSLKLDFSYGIEASSSESIQLASDVKAYLLRNSPDAQVTTIYPDLSDAKNISFMSSCF